SGQAEFTEKDSDYRADLVAALAAGLRDGARPPRSPENDPNLSAAGPKVVDEKLLADTKDSSPSWTPGGTLAITTRRDSGNLAFLIDPAKPDQRDELMRTAGTLEYCLPLGAGAAPAAWLIVESERKDPNSFTARDPTHLWILDGKSRQKRELAGPWGNGVSL